MSSQEARTISTISGMGTGNVFRRRSVIAGHRLESRGKGFFIV
jgi:hypothetical protein